MAKAIWVEGIESPYERTEVLRKELEKSGYKLSLSAFIKLLKGKKFDDIIQKLETKKIAIIGVGYKAPMMVGYGTMKLNGKCGFYLSLLKLKPEGPPEVRIIIENAQEFEVWFQAFVREWTKVIENPNQSIIVGDPQ